MTTVGETLVYALDNRLMPRDGRGVQRGVHNKAQLALPLAEAAADLKPAGGLSSEIQTEQKAQGLAGAADQELLREVFHQEGTVLQLDEPRLKADSKFDYARRLALLFVYAHEQDGRTQVSRADLNIVLQKVLDSNSRKFLRTHSGFEREGELYRLNKQGRDEAKAALKRIFDIAVDGPGWMPDGRGKAAKEDADSKSTSHLAGKRGRKQSPKPKEWAQKWKVGHASIDGHSLLERRNNADKGVFALWAVSKVATEDGKVVSEHLLSKFLLEAFIFKVDSRTLGRALASNRAKGKALKVSGGFQLQPPGTKWAQDLVAGKSV